MKIPIHVVDAFTRDDHPFSGNPAAICILRYDDDISDDLKQKIATQMNLSETVFISDAWSKGSPTVANEYIIRWFTPSIEAALCGHATVATSRTVFDLLVKDKTTNKITFHSKLSGSIEGRIDRKRQIITIAMSTYGLKPVDPIKNPWTEEMARNVLGPKFEENLVDDIQYCAKLNYLLFRLKETKDELVSSVAPNFTRLVEIEAKMPIRLKLIIVTQKADSTKGVHFYSRVFAPWFGILEDPVCGSAHVVMTPYWKRYYERIGVNDEELVGLQLSNRSGIVICRLEGDKVMLSGATRSFLAGDIDA